MWSKSSTPTPCRCRSGSTRSSKHWPTSPGCRARFGSSRWTTEASACRWTGTPCEARRVGPAALRGRAGSAHPGRRPDRNGVAGGQARRAGRDHGAAQVRHAACGAGPRRAPEVQADAGRGGGARRLAPNGGRHQAVNRPAGGGAGRGAAAVAGQGARRAAAQGELSMPYFTGSAELNAMVARGAPDVLGLLADGVPRAKAAIVAALAGRHDAEDVDLALVRLAVTGRLVEAGRRYTL